MLSEFIFVILLLNTFVFSPILLKFILEIRKKIKNLEGQINCQDSKYKHMEEKSLQVLDPQDEYGFMPSLEDFELGLKENELENTDFDNENPLRLISTTSYHSTTDLLNEGHRNGSYITIHIEDVDSQSKSIRTEEDMQIDKSKRNSRSNSVSEQSSSRIKDSHREDVREDVPLNDSFLINLSKSPSKKSSKEGAQIEKQDQTSNNEKYNELDQNYRVQKYSSRTPTRSASRIKKN